MLTADETRAKALTRILPADLGLTNKSGCRLKFNFLQVTVYSTLWAEPSGRPSVSQTLPLRRFETLCVSQAKHARQSKASLATL